MPFASADADVRSYIAFVHTDRGTDGILPETSFELDRPHDWLVAATESILQVNANYVTQAGATISPSAEFQVFFDAAALTECEWIIEGGTIAGGRSNPSISIWCDLAAPAEPGTHTIEIRRTSVTGTPITSSVNSIVLHQRDEIMHSTTFQELTGLTAFEFALFPLLAFLGYILWGRSEDVVVRGFGAMLGLLAGVLLLLFGLRAGLGDVWAGTVAFSAALMALGGYLLVRLMLDEFQEAAA